MILLQILSIEVNMKYNEEYIGKVKKLADFIIDYHKEKNTMIIFSSNIAMEDYFPVDVLNIIKF